MSARNDLKRATSVFNESRLILVPGQVFEFRSHGLVAFADVRLSQRTWLGSLGGAQGRGMMEVDGARANYGLEIFSIA